LFRHQPHVIRAAAGPPPLLVLTVKLVRWQGVKQKFIVGRRTCGAKSVFPILTRPVFGGDYQAMRFNAQIDRISKPALPKSRFRYPDPRGLPKADATSSVPHTLVASQEQF